MRRCGSWIDLGFSRIGCCYCLEKSPPFGWMIEMFLDAADMALQPEDIADVIVAELLPDLGSVATPLDHAIKGHVVAVIPMIEGILYEDGFGRILGLENHLSTFEEFARITMGGFMLLLEFLI